MARTKPIPGLCTHCGRPFDFLAESIGLTATCPHCGQETELRLAPPEPEAPPARPFIVWTVVGLLIVLLGLVPLVGLKHYQKKIAARTAARAAADAAASPASNAAAPAQPGSNAAPVGP